MKVKRIVFFTLGKSETVTVPDGEFWRGTIFTEGTTGGGIGSSISISKQDGRSTAATIASGSSPTVQFAENVTIKRYDNANGVAFNGLAFEI